MGRPPTVLGAVQRDLAELRKRDPELARGGLAAEAQTLARRMDDPESSASAVASCARALGLVMDRLKIASGWEQAPVEEGDRLDDLSARRAARRQSA